MGGRMDDLCQDCKWAVWDYEEYYGGARQWFLERCAHDHDIDPVVTDCEDYAEDDNEGDL